MNGNKAAIHEPDEIESFLRILIRRKIWFIVAFLVVVTLGGGWALKSAPVYVMSFDYEVAQDPMAGTSYAVAGSGGLIISSDLLVNMVEIEARKLGKVIASSNPEFSSSSLGRNIDVSMEDTVLTFAIPVTKENEALASQFELEIKDFLTKTIDSLRSQHVADVGREVSVVTSEIEKMTEAMLQSTSGGDTSRSELAQLAEEISGLALLKARLSRLQTGGLLEGPILSDLALSMSQSVKLILVFFVSIVAATLVAIAMEYRDRATRPI